jgi:hypothetical protein
MIYRAAIANVELRRAGACLLITSCLALAILLVVARPAAAAPGHDPLYSPSAQREASLHLAALGGTTFDANDLITDVNFAAVDSLSQAGVQSFLTAQSGTLASYQAPDHSGVKRSAAATICQAARAWQVSPKVILVTLQKEEGLLSAAKPSATALEWAMGCGVPDTGSRNTTYKGFGNQVWYGAESLHNDGQGFYAGITKACGDGTVQPADQASYALYRYTSWIGLVGGGNKLFWTLYWQYFGNPLAVDTVAPTTSVAGAAAGWHDSGVTLTFSALDNTGGTGVACTQYKLGSGPWTKATKLTIVAPASHADDGSHAILYRSADDAGNLEKAKSCTVRIDTTPPTTSVAGAGAGWHNKAVTLTFSAIDLTGGSGVASTQYKLDTGPWTTATKLTILAPASHAGDGLHAVLYRSVDKAANVEATHSCSVRIDTRRPKPVANWTATVSSGHTASLAYDISDPRPGAPTADVTVRVLTPAGHLVKKLKERGVPVNSRLVASFVCRLARGQYRFYVYATDAAGNTQSRVASNLLTVR